MTAPGRNNHRMVPRHPYSPVKQPEHAVAGREFRSDAEAMPEANLPGVCLSLERNSAFDDPGVPVIAEAPAGSLRP